MTTTETVQPPFATRDLDERVGRESHMSDVSRALVRVISSARPTHVSTLHVTCSDGLERERSRDFIDMVARDITPAGDRGWAPLRTANLGGRYEWGSGAVSFSHFDGPDDHLQVVQCNAHVGVIRHADGPHFGFYERGPRHSNTCGALSLLLAGQSGPFLDELREAFSSEGKDRVQLLRDHVAPEHRVLFAAVVNARLQARRALLDLARPLQAGGAGPDRLLILAAVTFNQRGADHELCVGHYAGARNPDGTLAAVWTGLGDDPTRYRFENALSGVQITQDGPLRRVARGPGAWRAEIAAELAAELASTPDPAEAAAAERQPSAVRPEEVPRTLDARALATLDQLDALLHDPDHPWTSLAAKGACLALTEVLAVPAVVSLFAGGALAANHSFRMRRIARGNAPEHEVDELAYEASEDLAQRDPGEARSILAGTTQRIRELYGR